MEYDDIEKTLYPELNNKIKERIQVKNASFSVENASKALSVQNNSVLAPVISFLLVPPLFTQAHLWMRETIY